MKTKFLILIAPFFIAANLQAQNILKGNVGEGGSNDKIPGVFIKDINAKAIALTDKKGNFEIATQTGHILVFSSPGYVSDTLYITDMQFKQVKLSAQGIVLRSVNVSSSREAFNPRTEYASVYEKSKVYPLSPSSWFGREAVNARRLKKYFAREEQERAVDAAFSPAMVSGLIPLKGEELAAFMFMYRPSYAFVKANTGGSMTIYVSDSYKKFKTLPPEKRVVPTLGAEGK